ncbi:unnamed protein product, partial [Discosporangium mesarthrocarpum]
STDEPWKEVDWDEALSFAAKRLREVQERHGRDSIGGITSSRCTNEETYLVQKLIRAAFGNNNTDTCARVCHSPTGYGLKTTLGESAGTQTFDSVREADVILVVGANPTDAHPVFASQVRRRLREGATLIVADPREIDLLNTPHTDGALHLPVLPGSNVALINALAHVVVSEGYEDQAFINNRCNDDSYQSWRDFIVQERNSPEAAEEATGVAPELLRRA